MMPRRREQHRRSHSRVRCPSRTAGHVLSRNRATRGPVDVVRPGHFRPMRSRRYDPYDRYPPPGYGRRWRRGYGGGVSSCLRDACLLETGCCIGEAIDDNCLLTGVLLIPQFLAALVAPARRRPFTRGDQRSVRALVAAIEVYQQEISANRPACCRFSPSCSHYAVEALRTHGIPRGLYLAGRRILRCRPGGRRGADPVPPP